MKTNRRVWLKQIGLGIVGASIPTLQVNAFTNSTLFQEQDTNNLPIILRSNENPYGPSPLALKAISNNIKLTNRYNWDIAPELIAELAKKNNVEENNILLGAGSTEILDLVAKYIAAEKSNYVIADPSYDYWTKTMDNLGVRKIKVALTADKKIDLSKMFEAINQETKLIYICNPNNPTGTICEREQLVTLIKKTPKNVTILVDEAYLEYTKEKTLTELIKSIPNLIIVKTFSKIHGLAGARIGYAVADSSLLDTLRSLQSNTNNSVSFLSKLAAIASIKDDKFINDCYVLNENVRKFTITELTNLNIKCIPSGTNFLYFSLLNYPKDYFGNLEKNKIQGTRIYEEDGKWTRITIGTLDEMRKFIAALK
ncbi:MAG: pyridoxal phosphate-dependent aminotransferase [Chryseobacterium jejuense]|uniref:pyridoxal phosphate-dependent aminotransferase n=1 Tax=Chryseobacterium jejuense TaxID=445960 RepID=UPI003D0C6E0E